MAQHLKSFIRKDILPELKRRIVRDEKYIEFMEFVSEHKEEIVGGVKYKMFRGSEKTGLAGIIYDACSYTKLGLGTGGIQLDPIKLGKREVQEQILENMLDKYQEHLNRNRELRGLLSDIDLGPMAALHESKSGNVVLAVATKAKHGSKIISR